MKTIFYFLVLILLMAIHFYSSEGKKTAAPTAAFAAVPRSKSSRGLKRLFSNAFVNRVIREVKTACSSQLEATILQVIDHKIFGK